MTERKRRDDAELELFQHHKSVPYRQKKNELPRYGVIRRETGDRFTLFPYYGSVAVEGVPGSSLRSMETRSDASYMDPDGELYLPDSLRGEAEEDDV